jgi:hypothetical protein
MAEIPDEHINECTYTNLEHVPVVDFKQKRLYDLLRYYLEEESKVERIIPVIIHNYRNLCVFSEKDKLYGFALCSKYFSSPTVDAPFLFKATRAYDCLLGFHVENASTVKACNLLFYNEQNEMLASLDFSAHFQGQNTVSISFLSSSEENNEEQKTFIYDDTGCYYSFCTGLPLCLMYKTKVYIAFTSDVHPDISPSVCYLSKNVQTQMADTMRDRMLRLQIGKYICYLQDGLLIPRFENNLDPYLQFLKTECNTKIDADVMHILHAYTY